MTQKSMLFLLALLTLIMIAFSIALNSCKGQDSIAGSYTEIVEIFRTSGREATLRQKYPKVFAARILYFGSAGCPHCPAQKAIVKQVQAAEREKYTVEFFEYAKHSDLFKWYRVRAIPTTLIVSKGKIKYRAVGKLSARRIREEADKIKDDEEKSFIRIRIPLIDVDIFRRRDDG